jgi:hypothetical protein
MALLVDLEVKVSVVGWPHHDPKFTGIPVDGPLIFVAAEGGGFAAVDLAKNFYRKPEGQRSANKIVRSPVPTPEEVLIFAEFQKEPTGLNQRDWEK